MPLTIRLVSGGRGAGSVGEHCRQPAVVCDHCGQEIACAEEGICQWLAEEAAPALFFTHNACRRPFEQARPGLWACMDLEHFPLYLANGLGIDWKRLQWKIELLSRP